MTAQQRADVRSGIISIEHVCNLIDTIHYDLASQVQHNHTFDSDTRHQLARVAIGLSELTPLLEGIAARLRPLGEHTS